MPSACAAAPAKRAEGDGALPAAPETAGREDSTGSQGTEAIAVDLRAGPPTDGGTSPATGGRAGGEASPGFSGPELAPRS